MSDVPSSPLPAAPDEQAGVVFVVDDDSAARAFVRATLKAAGFETGAFASAEEFLAKADLSRAGCLVTDVHMEGMTGVELQEQLRQLDVGLPVIVITGYATTSVAVRAMSQGAVAFLQKPYTAETLVEAVRAALAQRTIARQRLQRKQDLAARFARLRPEELAVLELLARGMGNKAIARDLDVSVRTIEARRRRIFRALGVRSATAAVRLHIEHKSL